MRLSTVKFLFIIIALIYFFSPWDILPDFFGIFGRVDDLLVILFLVWRYYGRARGYREQVEFLRSKLQGEHDRAKSNLGRNADQSLPFDPYRVLELPKEATKEEIHAAYKRLNSLYHPDKVAHLGDELKALAHNKTLEIQKAYKALSS